MPTDELPSYDDLPAREGRPAGSSWGLWGDDDVLGCLNLLGQERVLRGAGVVRKGTVFPLNLEFELPDPPLFGRPHFRHDVHDLPIGHEEELSGWNTQSSTQWDGFRHIRRLDLGHYNGVPSERHGVHHWARRGIAGRAVLADVARWREAQGRPLSPGDADPIEPSDLIGTLASEGVSVEPGDVLLVRTGWMSWYRTLDEDGRRRSANSTVACGLRPGEPTARVLWDLHVAAVAADNPSLEVWPAGALASAEEVQEAFMDPTKGVNIFVHMSLLPMLGMPIGELWDLDALAADCAEDGVYECFLTSAPLNLAGGVASPANALAFK